MSKTFPLRTRQIHLDFHTAPQINDVGREFDARQFARTLKRAHVNSVTVFAKCHHGHLYYNTRRPERHPGLRAGHDLLGEQVEALHREGIRAPIYLSVQCDEYAANAHPEWIARHPTGRTCGAQPFEAFGPGAARYLDGVRQTNHRSLFTWIKRLTSGESPDADVDELSPEHRAREAIFVGLRRVAGLDRATFRTTTGFDLDALAGDVLRQQIAFGLLEDAGSHVRLTREGRFVADSVIAEFL